MKDVARKRRARQIVSLLKKMYPKPKSELKYKTKFQFVVAVILSAQATDKKVNEITPKIFKKYKTACDFAKLDPEEFEKEINQISFFRNKAKNIIKAAQIVCDKYKNRVPRTIKELVELPGIGYKTANVVLGELFDIDKIEKILTSDPEIFAVAMNHHETSTGILNPVHEIGVLCKKFDKIAFIEIYSF